MNVIYYKHLNPEGYLSSKVTRFPISPLNFHELRIDLCIFHIWKKESSPDFSEAPRCCSRPRSLKPRCQPEAVTSARSPDWNHHHFLFQLNSQLWKAGCRARRYLWMQHAWSTLRGKLLPKSIFINISLLYWLCLYICIDVLLFLLNGYIVHSSTDIWPEILEILVYSYKC